MALNAALGCRFHLNDVASLEQNGRARFLPEEGYCDSTREEGQSQTEALVRKWVRG